MTSPTMKPDYGLGLSANTIRSIRSSLAAAFNFAVRRKIIEDNPVSETMPPEEPPSCARPLTLEEAWAFVSVKDRSWYGNALTFNLQTGLRPEELMALIWDDVDVIGRTLRIERACKWYGTGRPELGKVKSKRSDRVIELSMEHINFLLGHREKLKRHMAEKKKAGRWLGEPLVAEWVSSFRPRQSFRYQDTELIFPSRQGNIPYSMAPRLSFKYLLRAAGLTEDRLKVRWYDLRHTHATYLLTLGIRPHEVAARLGHSVEMLNKVYAHVLEGRQRRASSLFVNVVPVEISGAVSRQVIQNHIKRLAEISNEDMEASMTQLLGVAEEGG